MIEETRPVIDILDDAWDPVDEANGDQILTGDLEMAGLSVTAGFVGTMLALRWQ